MESNINPSQLLFKEGKYKRAGPEDIMPFCPLLPNNDKMEAVDRHGCLGVGRSRVSSSQAGHHCHSALRNLIISALSPSCGDRREPLLSTVQHITVSQTCLEFLLGLSLWVSIEWCCSYFCPSSLKECFMFLQSLGQRSWWLQGCGQRPKVKVSQELHK